MITVGVYDNGLRQGGLINLYSVNGKGGTVNP